ncbi:transglutaminase-like domain-containing protein [Clostridium weizhouense]|uniref:Transglutaminase-like domain-containing protein n=1 Tax=Clostridium weizhouense TaxID=2859781 RepID=A0ABS7AN24_9CLOT|nr:transglutaminase-like domain-containing protein [Clostridium weizhouense]MBW6410062.1 transglutaminase-like domain-containing protein [Clostridium weizhouense]
MDKILLYKIIIFGIIGTSILISIRRVLKNSNIDYAITPILDIISSIATFVIILTKYDKLNSVLSYLINNFFTGRYLTKGIVKILGLMIVFLIIRFVIRQILQMIQTFIFSGGKRIINQSKTLLIIFSIIFGIIRSSIFILIMFVPIIMFNSIPNNNFKIDVFNNIEAFNRIENIIDKNKIKIINNGLIQDIASNKIIYYNGVTLDEGVKSNNNIDEKAKKLTTSSSTDREKAKKLYSWIGSNITYDYDKANKVLNSQDVKNSGAISAYQEKRGICFDYACLYVAMSRAVGLNIRLITGEAYNGESYVSHAWNEVYLKDENKWIKVDPTFYNAGNYFDSNNFDEIHKKTNIAGEW